MEPIGTDSEVLYTAGYVWLAVIQIKMGESMT
jgi:hypothetical protein